MLALEISAELNGITNLRPHDTEDAPFYYNFKVQCTSCREVHPNWESNELSGSRGDANFVWKCKNCKREHSASIKNESPKAYNVDDSRVKIIMIDCRGLEFLEFKADGPWDVDGAETGTKFQNVDLSEGDWYDYDEKSGEEISITEIEFKIVRA